VGLVCLPPPSSSDWSPHRPIGLLIEYWKLTKAFNVTFHRHSSVRQITASPETSEEEKLRLNGGMKLKVFDKLFGIPLPFVMKWKLSDSYTTSKTREYDAIATVHLLYIVVPIVFGYSIYSLIHASVSHNSPPLLISLSLSLTAQVFLLLVSWQLSWFRLCIWVCFDDSSGLLFDH
jgi:hypothetical protein